MNDAPDPQRLQRRVDASRAHGPDDTSQWLDSHEVVRLIGKHRLNDVKVDVAGVLVPVDNVGYDPDADCIVIELYEGLDWRVALHTDPVIGGPQ
jgi:hypothetical protein